ncbi:MAG TPA: hypothetical protein VNA04_10520, partial [Thermoanaerobaculia bacterium]|nr:hypothetical protein [Thermoanaerobaculia bacterium]
GTIDPRAGDLHPDLSAPWIGWGAYLWANGTEPRSDGLIWERRDFANDGTHPSAAGQEKVGALLLDFLKSDPTSRGWFVTFGGPRRRAVGR